MKEKFFTPLLENSCRALFLDIIAEAPEIKLPLGIFTRPNIIIPRPLGIKRALLIGISYVSKPGWRLYGPSKDVEHLRDLLINCFGYSSDNITILSDKQPDPTRLPTQENILNHLKAFVGSDGACKDFFFAFSGHSAQRKESLQDGMMPEEDDGMEEFILPSDSVYIDSDGVPGYRDEDVITDKILHQFLVKPLPQGATMVTLFDSCHSGTLLNLRHQKCNEFGSMKSRFRELCSPVVNHQIRTCGRKTYTSQLKQRHASIQSNDTGKPVLTLRNLWINVTGWRRNQCSGLCARNPMVDRAQVICFSACKDEQQTHELRTGGQLITNFVKLLKKNRSPTYKEVMMALKYGVKASRNEAIKMYEASFIIQGSSPTTKRTSQLLNRKQDCMWPTTPFLGRWHENCLSEKQRQLKKFIESRSNPQLSTRYPLNMQSILKL